jgi:uncharacterized protein (DUF934 family)
MPRRLLRDRQIVIDDWRYVAEAAAEAGEPQPAAPQPAAPQPAAPIIVTLAQWQLEPDAWLARGSRLGLALKPADQVELIAADLQHFALIAAEFSGPAEGRGYTQARQLRERWKFRGELRAIGYVRLDQLFFMARCGFNSFEVAESDLEDAYAAFSTFSAAYQSSNDAGLPHKLRTATEIRAPRVDHAAE